jgi:hypothetical protein
MSDEKVTWNDALCAIVGDCPFCRGKAVDGYTVRNFIGVSIKATCSSGHRWTRQVMPRSSIAGHDPS